MSKLWKIPVTWEMYGVMNILADSLEEAKELAISDEGVLPKGDYVDGSFALDEDSVINEMNNGK